MTFAGAKFLFQLVASSIAMAVTIIFYFVISNIFFTEKTHSGYKIFLIIVALGLGIGSAILSYKFSRAWAIPIVAAGGGAMGIKLLVTTFGVNNNWAQLAGMLVGAALGIYVGKKFNNFVRTVGTAFLGSYILIRGFGFVFGGFPDGVNDVKSVKNVNNKVVYYFIGFVLAFIAGSVVQYKLFHDENHEEEKEDAF